MLEQAHDHSHTPNKAMPDVARDVGHELTGPLDWVGMEQIEMPVMVVSDGRSFLTPAKINAFVSLNDTNARGIHMSRLFLLLQDHLENHKLSFTELNHLLQAFVKSHTGLSNSSRISVKYELMVKRLALKSDTAGWRSYPVEMDARSIDGKLQFTLGTEVLYSSTCPCSAALARQLIQQKFREDFPQATLSKEQILAWLGSPQGIVATPHSQRSSASVRVAVKNDFAPIDLINLLEERLKTPVQAAVKRPDEQEFALLNGQNPLFCEDAARRLRDLLENSLQFTDYWIKVEHQESLHPHNAVSTVCKGIENGFTNNSF